MTKEQSVKFTTDFLIYLKKYSTSIVDKVEFCSNDTDFKSRCINLDKLTEFEKTYIDDLLLRAEGVEINYDDYIHIDNCFEKIFNEMSMHYSYNNMDTYVYKICNLCDDLNECIDTIIEWYKNLL